MIDAGFPKMMIRKKVLNGIFVVPASAQRKSSGEKGKKIASAKRRVNVFFSLVHLSYLSRSFRLKSFSTSGRPKRLAS